MTLEASFLVEALGWVATATFVASYLAKRAETLVRVQIAGALLWVVYGLLVRSGPVIAANVLVVGAAAWKARAPPNAAAGSVRTQPLPPVPSDSGRGSALREPRR